jgi:oligogalacturonide transport system substrate-binding protein
VLFQDAIQNIDYGKKTVQEVAADFQRQGDRILKRAMR